METTVHQRIRILIDRHYVGNIKAMATDVGIKPTTLTEIVAGRVNPSYDTILKILKADVIGVSPAWLMLGEGEIYGTSSKELEIQQDARSLAGAKTEMIEIITSQQATIKKLTDMLYSKHTGNEKQG